MLSQAGQIYGPAGTNVNDVFVALVYKT
jgi:hypothetical protein